MTLRGRIVMSLISVVAISGGVSTLTGGYFLQRHLAQEARNKVQQDLNAALEFYDHSQTAMDATLYYTSLDERFSQSVVEKDLSYLSARFNKICNNSNFDILSVTDAAGEVIYRSHHPNFLGDSIKNDRFVSAVMKDNEVVSGTMLISVESLAKEGASLADQASIQMLPAPKAILSDHNQLAYGMMLCSAAPVYTHDGKLAGVLRAGILLNRNYDLVDQVQNTILQAEQYQGKLLGTATIYQYDVRISTNFLGEDGSRAIGSQVSAEVYDHVIRQGETWEDRAWIVNDWYIAAYKPIYDIDNNIIGMLSVAELEGKFRDITLRTLTIFGLITCAGLLVAVIVAWKLSISISRPIRSLASASVTIAQGDFSNTLAVQSNDEIGSLTQSFNTMAQSLQRHDEKLKELTQLQLTRSEHLASIGRLAAGVAHEINNPLTGVLTFSHMLLKNAPEDSQEQKDIKTIIEATARCRDIIRGLLNFSRQKEPTKKLSDINHILEQALNLIRHQVSTSHINVIEEMDSTLPATLLDSNLIQEVAVNLLVNAIDAMPNGGNLTVCTRTFDDNVTQWVEFEVSDTGCGIPTDNIEHIFDPFFTTKQEDKGTGLGLAVSYGIVAMHEGHINVSSELNCGTTFVVRLPIIVKETSDEQDK